MLVALLGVLGVSVWGAFAVFAAPPGPTVSSFALDAASPTNASPVSWKVVFSASVTGVAASNFTLVQAGGVSGAGPISVVGSGTTYTVSATSGSGSGTLGLKLSSAGSIKDSSNKALQGAPYTGPVYAIDKVAPTVASIVRAAASPTNAASVSWTVRFSEDVNGVDATDFALIHGATPTGGALMVTPASGPVSIYTVSAPSGSGDGNLGLNLADDDTITDRAGNKLGGTGTGNGNFTGQVYVIDKTGPANAPTITAGPAQNSSVSSASASFSFSSSEAGVAGYQCKLDSGSFESCSSAKGYSGLAQGGHDFSVRALDAVGNPGPSSALRHWTVDTVAPPKPVLTLYPPDPSSTATSKFAWTDSEAGLTFQCSIENGPWTACTSPFTYDVTVDTSNNGQHQFAVRAIDAAGNASDATTYKWKVVKGSGQDFVIKGSVSGLAPGVQKSIPVTIDNPNSVPIYVSQLSYTLTASASSGTCPLSYYTITPWNAAPPAVPELTVPANASNFPVPPADQPKIKFNDSASNQDACKGKSFTLTFFGSAHS